MVARSARGPAACPCTARTALRKTMSKTASNVAKSCACFTRLTRHSQYRSATLPGGETSSASVHVPSAVKVTGTPARRSRSPKATTKAARSTTLISGPVGDAVIKSAEHVGLGRADDHVPVVGCLREGTQRGDHVITNQFGHSEH